MDKSNFGSSTKFYMGDRERSKLHPLQPLNSKQKLGKWILPGRTFVQIFRQTEMDIFHWEGSEEKGKRNHLKTNDEF